MLSELVKHVKKNRQNDIYYKIVMIRDQAKEPFSDKNFNEYPYNLETIVMCYVGQHKKLTNALTIQ